MDLPRCHEGPLESEVSGEGRLDKALVEAIDKDTGKRVFVIDRLWQWNGVKFVRILAEPTPG